MTGTDGATAADSGSDSDDEQTWVSCDACNKWRRVLDSQSLRSARRWRCSDNRDPRYASCATPQACISPISPLYLPYISPISPRGAPPRRGALRPQHLP